MNSKAKNADGDHSCGGSRKPNYKKLMSKPRTNTFRGTRKKTRPKGKVKILKWKKKKSTHDDKDRLFSL